MSKTIVGAIGGRVKGMTEIAYDEFSIKQKLGSRVVNLDEEELTAKVDAISDEEAKALLEEKKDMFKGCKITSTNESMLESMKFYKAMKDLAKEYELQALVSSVLGPESYTTSFLSVSVHTNLKLTVIFPLLFLIYILIQYFLLHQYLLKLDELLKI